MASLYRAGEVLERREAEGSLEFVVRLPPAEVERLRREGVEVSANGVATSPHRG